MTLGRPASTPAAPAWGVNWADRAFVVALVLAATLLRGWRLDHMSLWTDEGLSFYRATKDLPFLLSGRIDVGMVATQDVQPPLYFLALGAFLRAVGVSPWAAKAFSFLAAAPLVPLIWALGVRLAGRRAARLAALLAAASPVYLWYSQEVRGYTALVTLGALSTYALFRALGVGAPRRPGSRWALAAGASSAAMLWLHYLGFFLLAFQMAVVVAVGAVAAIHRRRRGAAGSRGPRLVPDGGRVALALAAAATAAVPLVPFAVARLGLGPERDQHFVPLAVIAQDVVRGFTLGLTVDWERLAWAQVPLAAAAALGAIAVVRRSRGPGLALVGWLALPPLGLFALTAMKPVYMGVRHVLTSSPPWYILLGASLAAVAQRGRAGTVVAALGAGVLVAGMAASDVAFYGDGTYAKDDLRGMVAYVKSRAVPGDALVLSDAVLQHVVDVYRPGIPVTAAPLPGDPRTVAAQLAALAADHPRLWFMTPEPAVAAWLEEHRRLVDRHSFPGRTIPVRVEAWEGPVAPRDLAAADGSIRGPDGATAAGAPGPLEVVGWRPRPTPAVAGAAVRVHVALRPVTVPPEVHLALRLVDAAGGEYGHGDQGPFHGQRPATRWPVGDIVVPPLDLFVSPGAPPGTYRVTLAVYDPATGERWPSAGDVVLGELEVVAPPVPLPVEAAPVPTRQEAVGGGWRIVGYEAPAGVWPAGEERRVPLWLRREGEETGSVATRLELTLWGPGGEASGGAALPAGVAAGALRRVDVGLAPPDEPGLYRLGAALRSAGGAAARLWPRRPPGMPTRRLTLRTTVRVGAVARLEEVPAGATAADLRFGDLATLAAYDVAGDRRGAAAVVEAGESITVTLYWRAAARSSRRLHVSVQLLPPAGAPDPRPVAQHDGPPAAGARPTTGWRSGEVVVDPHRLQVPPDLPPGEYPLAVAVYEPGPGGSRLPVDGRADAAGTVAVLTVADQP